MAKLQTKTKENPKLMQKTLADGRQSLYLEYYMGYNKAGNISSISGRKNIWVCICCPIPGHPKNGNRTKKHWPLPPKSAWTKRRY